jgi:glyoxylase-like metal-dependent hydrolase (beta-lactamase superfamily II)
LLRIVRDSGEEIVRAPLPAEGLFDVQLDDKGERAWCYPSAWFARGMAGRAWLPADADARTVYAFATEKEKWTTALQFPDAVSDLATPPGSERLLVSCWDGKLYLLDPAGQVQATVTAGNPARLRWNKDGRFAVAGTQQGEVICLAADGKVRWRLALPEAELPPIKQPVSRVFEEVPIFQVGRVGPEHAYVGDTWLIKTARGGILIDTGGTSGIPYTRQRLNSVGLELKDVPYLLHTHSHGDHCGAGYLWRAMGLKVVAPESANFTLAWLMPTLTDYGVWPPRPVDLPLPLKIAGDEKEFTVGDLKVRAIFVPGHSFDSVIYAMELDGKRVVFTGDIGFDNQDILHRCWGDIEKAKVVTEVVRTKVLPFKPDFLFSGHMAKRDGTAFLEGLVKRTQDSIREAEKESK